MAKTLPDIATSHLNSGEYRAEIITREDGLIRGVIKRDDIINKNGKVRLMLDRKANAKTITLEPEMFAMLADMVKATQQQGAIQC
ncbi:hypothetical protein [Gallibacterium anatis]|uniref:hypothetical protein n=1 Tax=Gallibacterium anatis TaxID=750 RepID=UPI0005312B70|nr:hypothetical protein [Gallibacterium anatis]KGQ42084.1 hypothetical protein JP30_02480 [Gallibacterium anatis IPDH697-78]